MAQAFKGTIRGGTGDQRVPQVAWQKGAGEGGVTLCPGVGLGEVVALEDGLRVLVAEWKEADLTALSGAGVYPSGDVEAAQVRLVLTMPHILCSCKCLNLVGAPSLLAHDCSLSYAISAACNLLHACMTEHTHLTCCTSQSLTN